MDICDFICIGINQDYAREITREGFQKQSVKMAATIFRQNIEQAQNLVDMPGMVANAVYELGKAWSIAHVETTGKPWTGEILPKDKADDVVKRHRELYSLAKEDPSFSLKDSPFTLIHMGFMNPELPLGQGYQSIVKGMIVYAWGACENLMRMLYEDATGKQAKSFQSAWGLYKAFQTAFETTNPGVYDAVKNDRIRAFWLVRNVIVHSNAVIDSSFIKDSEAVTGLDEFRSLGIGKPIPLTSPIVSRLVNSFHDAVWDVIREFDQL